MEGADIGMKFPKDENVILQPGATTIMMRRLPLQLTITSLEELLSSVVPGQYDFIYFPCGKRKGRNIALAFINFTSHLAAQAAVALLIAEGTFGDRKPQVRQSEVQGLGPNLAYYVARFGWQEFNDPSAPRVYRDGQHVESLRAVCQMIDMEMVKQAMELLSNESRGLVASDGRRRRGVANVAIANEKAWAGLDVPPADSATLSCGWDRHSNLMEPVGSIDCTTGHWTTSAHFESSTSFGSRSDSPSGMKTSSSSSDKSNPNSRAPKIEMMGPRVRIWAPTGNRESNTAFHLLTEDTVVQLLQGVKTEYGYAICSL